VRHGAAILRYFGVGSKLERVSFNSARQHERNCSWLIAIISADGFGVSRKFETSAAARLSLGSSGRPYNIPLFDDAVALRFAPMLVFQT